MARMRDRLIHDYFGVDLDIVWRVLQTIGVAAMIAAPSHSLS